MNQTCESLGLYKTPSILGFFDWNQCCVTKSSCSNEFTKRLFKIATGILKIASLAHPSLGKALSVLSLGAKYVDMFF